MNVYIIGSLSQEQDIEAVADYFEQRGDTVKCVRKESPYKPFAMIVDECFRNIRWADLVVALKKSDDSFGPGTTYELAYARTIGKNYRYAIPAGSGTYNVVSGLTAYALTCHRKEDYTLVRHFGVLYLVDKESGVVFEQPQEIQETIY